MAQAVACANEGAQDLDVFGTHAQHAADALHFDDVCAGAGAVAQGVCRAAGFARFGARTGGMTPGLVTAGDG